MWHRDKFLSTFWVLSQTNILIFYLIQPGYYKSIDLIIKTMLEKIFEHPSYKKYSNKTASLISCTVDPVTQRTDIKTMTENASV